MQTFFINMTGKPLRNRDVYFEIQRENKQLIPMDCPLEGWANEETGYRACVQRMAEQIDSDKAITNAFRLLLYADLQPFGAPPEKKEEGDLDPGFLRFFYRELLQDLLARYVGETILAELKAVGRSPESCLMIFSGDSALAGTDPKADDKRKEKYKPACVRRLLGLPDPAAAEYQQGDTFEAFREKNGLQPLQPPLPADLLCGEFWDSLSSEKTYPDFLNKIADCKPQEIQTVSFAVEAKAINENKQKAAERDLRLYAFILKCAESDSVPQSVPEYDAKKAEAALLGKYRSYRAALGKVDELSGSYSDLELAPKLQALQANAYGLDPYGEPAEANAETSAETLLSEKVTLKPDQENPQDIKESTAEKCRKWAETLKKHHETYLKKLQDNVSDQVSHYAGRSLEHKEATLERRAVRVAQGDYSENYKGGSRTWKFDGKDTKNSLETVQTFAGKAYLSVRQMYAEFCAGRAVAVTDLEEQYKRFLDTVNRIEESLRKLRTVALGLLIALLVLYIPFFLLQWRAIAENPLTPVIAAASLALPLLILFTVWSVLSGKQKKRFGEALEEFKGKSDALLNANNKAVEAYEELLNRHIPALRQVYDYTLDVAFYAECCRKAAAKLGHHRQKLAARADAVRNLLEDLELSTDADEQTEAPEIEYSRPFCEGETNCELYSVFDKKFLEEFFSEPTGTEG